MDGRDGTGLSLQLLGKYHKEECQCFRASRHSTLHSAQSEEVEDTAMQILVLYDGTRERCIFGETIFLASDEKYWTTGFEAVE
jgi:hypothetical protein